MNPTNPTLAALLAEDVANRVYENTASPGAVKDFNNYLTQMYGDKPPKWARDILKELSGDAPLTQNLNDFALGYMAVGDSWRYSRPELAIRSGISYPTAASYVSPYLGGEVSRPGREINNLPWDEGGRRIEGTGLGVFGPIASIAGAAFGMPALTFLSTAASNPNSPLSLAAPISTGIQTGNFSGIGNSLSGGGFTNPAAISYGGNPLGLTASDYSAAIGYSPASLPAAATASNQLWSGTQNLGLGFVNPSALATPDAINAAINYNPVSLGGTQSTGTANRIVDAGLKVAGLLAPQEQAQAPTGLLNRAQGAARTPYTGYMPPAPPSFRPYFKLATRAS